MPSSHEAYAAMLTGLAAQTGLDAAQLLEKQEISIDGVVVVLSHVGDALQCVCEVAQLPPEPPAELLQFLLQANTLGKPTQGSTLGLGSSGDLLMLAQRVPLDVSVALASRTCLHLAAMAVVWATALSELTSDTSLSTV